MSTPINTREPEWNAQLDDLVGHVQATGRVPYPRPGQDPRLERMAQWAAKQRRLVAAGLLKPELEHKLTQVPGLLVTGLLALRAELADAKRELADAQGELADSKLRIADYERRCSELRREGLESERVKRSDGDGSGGRT